MKTQSKFGAMKDVKAKFIRDEIDRYNNEGIIPTAASNSESEWKKKLTPEQYHVLRKKGTELPFSGKYDQFFDAGNYKCAACGNVLFTSDTKYDSGCGWPAFFEANKGSIVTKDDISHGTHRIEVMCKRCGGHLGHVFDDGPRDKGGKRYCINSVALSFERKYYTYHAPVMPVP